MPLVSQCPLPLAPHSALSHEGASMPAGAIPIVRGGAHSISDLAQEVLIQPVAGAGGLTAEDARHRVKIKREKGAGATLNAEC